MAAMQKEIDLAEGGRLVAGLERDLAKVSGHEAEIQRVRDELKSLRKALNSEDETKSQIRRALGSIQKAMQNAMETGAGEAIRDWPYIAEIGRIVGMR